MSQDEKFEFESVQDCQTIQKYLQALQAGFESGRIVLNADGSEMSLNPEGYMRFVVTAKRKGLENKLSIKVSWKDHDGKIPASGHISITS
jgi:amphi-Trp domain-containing protein